jgi:hypothetical protein
MFRTINHPRLEENYTRYCTLLRKVIRRAKAMYYDEIIMVSTSKSKVSWKIINNEIGQEPNKKFTYSELRDGNVKIYINNAAKLFNNYFLSSVNKLVGQHFNNEGFLSLLCEGSSDKFTEIVNIPVIAAEALSTILSLKNNTSCGYDGLSNEIIK